MHSLYSWLFPNSTTDHIGTVEKSESREGVLGSRQNILLARSRGDSASKAPMLMSPPQSSEAAHAPPTEAELAQGSRERRQSFFQSSTPSNDVAVKIDSVENKGMEEFGGLFSQDETEFTFSLSEGLRLQSREASSQGRAESPQKKVRLNGSFSSVTHVDI